ncbi:MAG: DUF5665 domain-containing protein [Pseudomonadota bacterium]
MAETGAQTSIVDRTDTTAALDRLSDEVARLNSHSFITLHNRPWRLLGFQFAKGLAFGLGTVIGASILVSAIAVALAQIEFLPIIGEWAAEIARQIDAAN